MAEPSVPVTSQISLSETIDRREERLSSVGQIQLRTDLTTTSWALWALLLGGALITNIEARGHAAAALLWALACLVVGNIAGFLFAIPRVPRTAITSKTAEDPGTSLETVAASRAAGERGFGLGINTNLEEISDWLTKILVGVGLIELRSLPDAVRRMGYYVGQG